jgi:DNA repair photolyase
VRYPGREGFGVPHVPRVWVGEVRVTMKRQARSKKREAFLPLASRVSPVTPWMELHRTSHGASYIGIVPTQVLNTPSSTGMVFWSLNPYIGCEFGCAYCYARETHRWTVERAANRRSAPDTAREAARLPAAQAFEQRILIKHNADEVLARTLDPIKLGTTPLVIGSATDPYQPAERRFGITRRVLEVFRHHEGMRIGIITKSALVSRDTELLAELSKQHRVTVHFSIASVDRALLRQLEPRSAAPHARLRAMARLSAAGVRTDVLIMPILPGLTDGEAELRELMVAAREAGAMAVTGGALRMGPATRHTLLPWLDRHRPALAARYRAHYDGHQYVSKDYSTALQQRLTDLQCETGFDRFHGEPWQPMQGELFERREARSERQEVRSE